MAQPYIILMTYIIIHTGLSYYVVGSGGLNVHGSMSFAIHASTSLLRSRLQLSSLIEHVQEISTNRTLLYALSHNTPDLEQTVRRLSACAKETIGCLSAPVEVTNGKRRSNDTFFSCSIAVVDSESCQSFSTLKAGEGPLQVGRWHSFRKKDDAPENAMLDDGTHIDWEDIWNRKSNPLALPPELLDVVYVETCTFGAFLMFPLETRIPFSTSATDLLGTLQRLYTRMLHMPTKYVI